MFIAKKHIHNINVVVAVIRKIEQTFEGHYLGVIKDLRREAVFQKQELKGKIESIFRVSPPYIAENKSNFQGTKLSVDWCI